MKRKTWKVVGRSENAEGSNILVGWFALAIKEEEIGREFWKAQFIVEGHKYFMKKSLVHNYLSLNNM